MKKHPKFVGPLGRWAVGPLGRWAVGPLGRWAVGPLVLCCGLLMLPRCAAAGEWELIPIEPYSGIALHNEQEIVCAQGGVSYSPNPSGAAMPQPFASYLRVSDENDYSLKDMEVDHDVYPTGGAGHVNLKGWFRSVLRWKPKKITNGQGESVPDPEDNPSPFIYLRVKGIVVGGAQDINSVDDGEEGGTGWTRNPAKESAEVTLSIEGIEEVFSAVGTSYNQANNPTDPRGETSASIFKTILLKIPSNGRILVPGPKMSVTARGALKANRNSVLTNGGSHIAPNGGQAKVYASYKGELTNYQLAISSDIETSWRKHTGPLPTGVYRKKVNGQYINARLVSDNGTPTDLTDDIWALKCLRNPNGLMDVHSAAQWFAHPDYDWLATRNIGLAPANQNWHGGMGNWFGVSTLTANHSGFGSYPFITWTRSGGEWQSISYDYPSNGFGGTINDEPRLPTVTAYPSSLTFSNSSQLRMPLRYGSFTDQFQMGVLGYLMGETEYGVEGVRLAGDDNLPLPATSFLMQAQENQNGATVGPILDAPSYAINWHRPEENWKAGTLAALPSETVYDSTPVAPGFTETTHYDSDGAEIFHPSSTSKIQAGFTEAGAIASLFAPQAPIASRVLYFLSATLGLKAQFVDPSNSPVTQLELQVPATYGTLRDEINAHLDGSGFPDGTPVFEGVEDDQLLVMRSAFAGPSQANVYWNGSANGTGAWTITANVSRSCTTQQYNGDAYDSHGYTGPTNTTVNRKDPPIIIRTWKWTPYNNVIPTPTP